MAFLRFSRDKRGYEYFYLVEPATNRRGKTRSRVLYWFRTPPGVKVGREPFDPDVRRALETQNPGIAFDWRKIVETPIPSADVERWRERRRAEKAEKAARQALLRERQGQPEPDADLEDDAEPENGLDEGLPDASLDAGEAKADALPPTEESIVEQAASIDPTRRRRRRRRRRGSRSSDVSTGTPGSQSAAPDASSVPETDESPESQEPSESQDE